MKLRDGNRADRGWQELVPRSLSSGHVRACSTRKNRMKKPVATTLMKKPEIFICHSSFDKKLLEEIKIEIEQQKCIPFIAQQKISGSNPCENIMLALWRSDALFAILTENALTNQSTRDWIFYEVGFAKGVWREKKKYLTQHSVFAWKHPDMILPRGSPIEFITTYRPLKRSRKSRNQMLEEMKEISIELWSISFKEALQRARAGLHFEMVEAEHDVSGIGTSHERSHIRVKMFIRNTGKTTTIRKIRIVNMNPDYLAKQLKTDTKSFEVPQGKDRECDEIFSFYGTMFAGVDSIELDLEFTHTEGIKHLHVISRSGSVGADIKSPDNAGVDIKSSAVDLNQRIEAEQHAIMILEILARRPLHVEKINGPELLSILKEESGDNTLQSYNIKQAVAILKEENMVNSWGFMNALTIEFGFDQVWITPSGRNYLKIRNARS